MSTSTLTAAPARLRGQPEPRSEAGRRLVAAVDALGPTFAERNREDERVARFPAESLADLRQLGYLRAPFPEELGGLGVTSVHDLMVAAARLARSDASLAIGVNMHMVVANHLAQGWRTAVAAGDLERAEQLAGLARMVADSGVAVAAASSEPGGQQDLMRPATTASRAEGGWRIDGVKAFATMSTGADLLSVAVTYLDDDGEERIGFAMVAPGTPGCTVHDDWDALGMRSSGSGRVTFDGAVVDQLTDSHPAGRASAEGLDRYLLPGLFHGSAALGIAELAHRVTVVEADDARRERMSRDRAAQLVADNVVDLGAMWATLLRAADRADEHLLAAELGGPPTLEVAADVFAQAQAAKALIDRLAPQVVDRALELSGGAGYLTGHPLAQAYRDVRASAFMHPYGANRASAFLAAVELGQDTAIG